MAKIKINKLPKGFTVKEGKVVKEMQMGGQNDYGLSNSNSNMAGTDPFGGSDIKYSLASVPREVANLEAEGGETVLTDLNNDGSFGLYNITGPRHSSGGVPMFLPEQSFIFSDTQKMKFGRETLSEFNIQSRKKMTPADVSKRYQLNEFLGALSSPDVDTIKAKSADLMLDKNMNALSKLAFAQESMKQFSDGVPLAAYPYLVSQGQDPVEFTAKVENMTKEQALMKSISAMSPEQQQQVMAIRDIIDQQGGMEAMQPMEMPMAQYGLENYTVAQDNLNPNNFIRQFPVLDLDKVPSFNPNSKVNSDAYYIDKNGSIKRTDTPELDDDFDLISQILSGEADTNLGAAEITPELLANTAGTNPAVVTDPVVKANNTSSETNPKRKKSSKTNVAYDPAVVEFYKKYGIDVNTLGIGESMYKDTQRYKGDGFYGDAAANQEGFFEAWDGIYEDIDALKASVKAQGKSKKSNPDVLKFQKWLNSTYIPEEVGRIKQSYLDEGKEWTDEMNKTLSESLLKDYGFNDQKGKGEDGDYGTFTSSRRPLGRTAKPGEPEKEEEKIKVEPKDPEYKYEDPDFNYYTQDLRKLGALAMRDRELFLPWQPQVEIPKADYVLEDPTRQLADTNEQLNIAAQAYGAFAGPQSMNARLAQARSNAFRQNANVFGQVHGRNINTVNQGQTINAQLRAGAQKEQRDRNVKLYDDTNLAEQFYLDEKNLDREQMADLLATADTNAANTYNMNTLYPYFNVDPTQHGKIEWEGGAPPLNLVKPSTNKLTSYDEQVARALDLRGRDLGDSTINGILGRTYGKAGAPTQTSTQSTGNSQADSLRYIRENYGTQFGYQSKRGKEVKKFLPFYLGKMGY